MAALGKGISPLLVRPGGLVAYWPLIGNASPEIDPVGGINLSWNATPLKADHYPIILPRARKLGRRLGGVQLISVSAALEAHAALSDAALTTAFGAGALDLHGEASAAPVLLIAGALDSSAELEASPALVVAAQLDGAGELGAGPQWRAELSRREAYQRDARSTTDPDAKLFREGRARKPGCASWAMP